MNWRLVARTCGPPAGPTEEGDPDPPDEPPPEPPDEPPPNAEVKEEGIHE